MSIKLRFSALIVLLVFLCGSLPSTARAGNNAGAGDNKLNQIRHNPCGSGVYDRGGTHSIPTFECSGWGGVGATINVLIREWRAGSEYPFVGDPFYLSTGVDLAGSYISTEKNNITFNNQISFIGYKTEIRLVPIKVVSNWDFNGTFTYDPAMATWEEGIPSRIIAENPPNPKVSSGADLYSKYYPTVVITNNDEKEYLVTAADIAPFLGGDDRKSLVVVASKSSYHAEDPSTYRGEPAYRLGVTAHYLIQAKASWKYYQEWVSKKVGEETVCRPGWNSAGMYECFLYPGDHYWYGHYVTETVYDYDWGDKQGSDGNTGWVNIGTVETDKVRWPDGTIHDHIPILIYQSQPLLQQP